MLNENVQEMENGRLTTAGKALRNGYPWLPKEQRKKILLLSDDL